MLTLGIDQSFTSTGVCIFKDNELVKSAIIVSNKSDNMYERAFSVSFQLKSVVDKWKPDIIALEGIPFMSRSNVTRDLAGLQYAIVMLLLSKYELDKNLYVLPPTSVKKFASGSGKASKEEMFLSLPKEIQNKFGNLPKSKGRYDLTDSYFIGLLGESKHEDTSNT